MSIVPVPVLVNPRLPAPSAPSVKFPLKVVFESLPPAVNVAGADSLLFVTVPLPANEPTVLELPLRSRTELTVKAELGLNAVMEPA